jgi:lycopene cyclase domain-containing protein
MTYTALAGCAVLMVVGIDLGVRRSRLTLRREFWIAYGIVLFFQLLTNGWLTGRRIVQYNAAAVLGGATPKLFGSGRLGYAPVEDLLFGFALVLWTLLCWDALGRLGAGAADQDRRARR